MLNLFMWLCILASELVIFKFMIINPIRGITDDLINNWSTAQSIILLIIQWIPVIALYLSSIQFVYTVWVGIFGYFFGVSNGVCYIRSWSDVIDSFIIQSKSNLPMVVEKFRETMLPNATSEKVATDGLDLEMGSAAQLHLR